MKLRLLMFLPPVIFVALGALFFFGMFREDPDALPSTMIGRSAPPVALEALPGLASFDDASLRSGEVVLVNFWASWCGPCRAEHPYLEQLAEQGIKIYGVNYKDQPDKAIGFLEELGNPFAAVGADSGRVGLDWGLYGVPETFVIDGDGVVRLRFAGPISPLVLETRIMPAIEAAR